MSKIIEVVVRPNGQSEVATKGFTGADCQQASRFVELALGKRLGEQLTVEFYFSRTAFQQRQAEG